MDRTLTDAIAGVIQQDAQVAELIQKLAAAEKTNARLLRILEGANDTIRNQRDRLSACSPKAEEQLTAIAAKLELVEALKTRVAALEDELRGDDEPTMASADEMIDRDTTCGFDCSCPSLLHHRIASMISEFHALPQKSASFYMERLSELLDEDSDR